jgi:DNA-binding response OmpR family regulator
VTLRRQPTAATGAVLGDADRLMQVLGNLISNAIKFSPPGGVVTLTVLDHDATLRLCVHDDGPGIPDEFRDRMFSKFAQADASDSRQKGGTGLGLSIAKRIVERHGGRIGFDSDTHGGGTTFWVELQRWQEPLDAVNSDAADAQRVLVCEDDVDIAAILAFTLRSAGLAVDVAYSMREARALLAAHDYAAMTLDLLLPDGNGLDLLQDLRADPTTATLPVIVVSAQTDTQRQIEHVGALAVAGWLRKPVRPDEVFAAVRHAARGHAATQLRVLHVEDDADVISVVRMALHDIATVTPATTLAAAQALLQREHFEAIVLDIALPDGSGLELLAGLRELTAEVPVVIFSAQDPGVEIAQQVCAALVKSKASIADLVAAIKLHAQHHATD